MFRESESAALAAMASLVITLASNAAVIYVDDSANGANDGTSWEDAYTDLEDGLAAAQSGDEVRIAQGTYKPAEPGGPREATFSIPNGVIVRGGYAGASAPGSDPDANDPDQFETILSGDLNGNDGKPGSWFGYEENSYHVISALGTTAGTELRGVTVQGGSADDPVFEGTNNRGGGVFSTGTLLIGEAVIQDCQAWLSGGGASIVMVAAEDTVVRRNRQTHSQGGGGGLSAGAGSTFANCRFEVNSTGPAASGGAISGVSFSVDSCIFIGNHGNEQGGAISCEGAMLIHDSQFINNGTGVFGGAIIIFTGTISITDSLFNQNASGDNGGAVMTMASA